MNVLVQCVIHRKLARQALLVTDPGEGKALGDGAQSKTFRGDMLLPLDVSSSDDQREPVKGRVRQFVLFENGFKRTASSPVIQLHFGKPWSIATQRFLHLR